MYYQPHKIIMKLESINSRLIKEAIITSEAQEENHELFKGFIYALDNMITFGVKKVPIKDSETHDTPGLLWQDFEKLLLKLQSRELSGNAAKAAIEAAMITSTQDQWNNWYRRILIKDLRCGMTESTINKSLKSVDSKFSKKYIVPTFSCQLAKDSNNHSDRAFTGKKQVDIKLDGARVLSIVYPNGKVDQFSRNGKSFENFPHIKQQLALMSNTLSEPWVFDGEIMSAKFQDLMRQLQRKTNVQTSDAVLYLFDAIPLSNFKVGKYNVSQKNRTKWLIEFCLKFELNNIRVVATEELDLDTPEGQLRLTDINKLAIENGYEGIMIKDVAAPYECKRTSSWLKLKPYIEVSLEVIDIEEGSGKNTGTMGALVCTGIEEDQGIRKEINVNVGTGFSDSDRQQIWKNKKKVIGQIVEVRADAITMNQDGTYSLRFPRFERWRGFSIGEKI